MPSSVLLSCVLLNKRNGFYGKLKYRGTVYVAYGEKREQVLKNLILTLRSLEYAESL